MNITIELITTSKPLTFENVDNTYTKGGMFCVYNKKNNEVIKFPLCNIFRVKETY